MTRNNPTWTILNPSSFASLSITLPPSTTIQCESDAVVTMTSQIDVTGVLSGGLFQSLLRSLFANESFFTTHVTNATSLAEGEVVLAPASPGGLAVHELRGGLLLTSGSFVAASEEVTMTTVMTGRLDRSILAGTGLFLLKATGMGKVALGAYGAIVRYELRPGERRVVDNGHLVGWSETMSYKIRLASRRDGVWGSLTSGEGLMCEFEGPGVVYIQSHKMGEGGGESGGGGGRSKQRRGQNQNGLVMALPACVFLIVFGFFVIIFLTAVFYIVKNGGDFDSDTFGGDRGKQYEYRYRPTEELDGYARPDEF